MDSTNATPQLGAQGLGRSRPQMLTMAKEVKSKVEAICNGQGL